jgi:hypothetical protein
MNADERRASKAELSKKAAKQQQKAVRHGPCHVEGCTGVGSKMCSRCRKVGYCSADCQRKDWNTHKEECKSNLPTFVNSITKKEIATYPVGTVIEMVGGTAPFKAKIRKFNRPGEGRPNDSTVEGLATYSLQSCNDDDEVDGGGEVWDEACEDVHDKHSWKRIIK